MNDLLLSVKDRKRLELFIDQKRPSVLLFAPKGYGKSTILQSLAGKLGVAQYDRLYIPKDDSDQILIEDVREIRQFLRTKPNNSSSIRAVIISGLEKMGVEAQNAILKVLEEPNENVIFLMSANTQAGVLPTILSRVEAIHLAKMDKGELQRYFLKQGLTEPEIDKAIGMSGGLVGQMHSILSEGISPVAIERVKQCLASTIEDRLASIDDLAKDKDRLAEFMQATERLMAAKIAVIKPDDPKLSEWTRRARLVIKSTKLLEHNVSSKLVLTDLFISI